MRNVFWAACLVLLISVANCAPRSSGDSNLSAQPHTIIALGHEDHSVNEIDPTTGNTVHKFTAVDQPHEAAVSPDGKTIYAAVPSAAQVVILDATTFQEKGKIESPFFHGRTPQPAGARGQREGQRGGAAPRANPLPGLSFPDSASPHGMGITTDGSKLFIGLENADVPAIVVYDTKAGTVLEKIDVKLHGGHYLQVQPKTDKVYAPFRTDNKVMVIDGKTNAIQKVIDVPGGPVGVDFAPNGEVWIHGDGNNGVEGQVVVIDSKTDTVTNTIQTPGKGAGRMAVSRDGKWAASTHQTSKDVAIIDAAKKQVVATVDLGGGPGFPIFSPDSKKLYVMVYNTNDIAVIDLASMKVENRWKAGEGTFGGTLRYPNGRPSFSD